MSGKLYGVGVGPGDPKLMTYLAVETIKNCPVIAVPADGKEHAISYKIASGIVKDMDQKECLGLSSPMTKDRKILEKNYQKVSEEIIKKLDEGKNVAYLTLGDPTVYSTYIYIQRIVKKCGYDAEIHHFVQLQPNWETALQTDPSSFILFHLTMISKRR